MLHITGSGTAPPQNVTFLQLTHSHKMLHITGSGTAPQQNVTFLQITLSHKMLYITGSGTAPTQNVTYNESGTAPKSLIFIFKSLHPYFSLYLIYISLHANHLPCPSTYC